MAESPFRRGFPLLFLLPLLPSPSSLPLPLPPPLPTSMINHERKRFNFFGAREMQTSSIPVVEEGRKLFLERQLKALARVWTRSNLGKAWNELRKLARKKREREREREIEMKEKRAFLSPLPPLSFRLSHFLFDHTSRRKKAFKLLPTYGPLLSRCVNFTS